MKLKIIAALLFLSAAVFAQKKDVKEKDVPLPVLKTFAQKYPHAKERTWKTKNGEYEVDFYFNQKKYEAKFESDGAWKKTTTKITQKDVPTAVFTSFKASEYAKWYIEDVYSVEDNKHKNLYQLKVVKGNNTMELLYTPEGDMLKSKSKN